MSDTGYDPARDHDTTQPPSDARGVGPGEQPASVDAALATTTASAVASPASPARQDALDGELITEEEYQRSRSRRSCQRWLMSCSNRRTHSPGST